MTWKPMIFCAAAGREVHVEEILGEHFCSYCGVRVKVVTDKPRSATQPAR